MATSNVYNSSHKQQLQISTDLVTDYTSLISRKGLVTAVQRLSKEALNYSRRQPGLEKLALNGFVFSKDGLLRCTGYY